MADNPVLDDLRARISALESGSAPAWDSAADGGSGREGRDTPSEHAPSAGKGRGAFEKIVALVNASDKSELTLRKRLEREGFDGAEIEEALAKAEDYGFIDDERFGRLLIESRLRQGWGSTGIERDLRKNGIDPSSFPGWPDAYDMSYEAELDRALALLDRRPPRTKNLWEGAYRKAVQKGFPSAVAAAAARLWCEEGRR